MSTTQDTDSQAHYSRLMALQQMGVVEVLLILFYLYFRIFN